MDQAEVAAMVEALDPASDIGRAKMRASLKHKLFGAPQAPIRLGRFVLMDRLGQGGMGVVYSAYDPDLDRRVALKLLRTGTERVSRTARERLLREAQALARLSHPNVVPVYEVGVLDEQVFIVMEFVVGKTLRDWATNERSWREVLDAYRQAGQGLAAAHAVGLVHRDFKPDNVLVGDDGRIRVLDFGLARGPADQDAPPSEPGDILDEQSSARRLNTPLTQTGAVLGTPAYMPLEQFDGAKVGPASDQFSFCVSLYEGLYRGRPFAGESLPALRESTKHGDVRSPPRSSGAPRWIFPILCRGLAPAPEARYPSMDALLAALGRDPARRRRRVLVAVLGAALIGVSIVSVVRSRPAAIDVCQGAERELASIWNEDRKSALEQAFSGTGRAYAQEAWSLVARGLDRYAGAWVTMHEQACRAHQRGEQSGALLDRRMACLRRRKLALSSAIAVLSEIDATSLEHAVEAMQKLPAIAYCADSEALAAEVRPPEDPEVAARVDALRERLSRARALEDAGRYADALALAADLSGDAERTGYRPLWAEVLLLEGRIRMAMGKRKEAVAPLRRATALGLATGMNEVGLQALARSIFAEATSMGDADGGSGRDPGEVLRPVYIAEALLERVPDPTFVHALLLNNIGVVHLARGDRDQAREAFERALAVENRTPGTTYVELSVVPSNLALVTSDPQRRAALLDSASQEIERALGPAHPRTLELRIIHSHYIFDAARARSLIDATCARYAQYHPTLRDQLADCLYSLGFLDAEQGDWPRAGEHLSRAAAHVSGSRVWLRELARGQALLYQGDPAAALAAAEAAAGAIGAMPAHWWNDKLLAEALLTKGLSLVALAQHDAAISALTNAQDTFERLVEINHSVNTQRLLARARIALATALWDAAGRARARDRSRDRARATALIARAQTWYGSAGPGNEEPIRALEMWRQARGLDE